MITIETASQQARTKYALRFQCMSVNGGRWHLYAVSDGVELAREGHNGQLLVADIQGRTEPQMLQALHNHLTENPTPAAWQ